MQGRATFQLAGGVEAPAKARQIVSVTIGVVLPEDQAYQASLLTSEIVSNSVLHGRAGTEDQIELALSWDPDRFGGWGLALVETISDRWGIERGDRTRVWFELGRAEAA